MKYLVFWQKTHKDYIIYVLNIDKYGSFNLFWDRIVLFKQEYQRFDGKIANFSIFDKRDFQAVGDEETCIWLSLDVELSPLMLLKLNKLKFTERRSEGAIKIRDVEQVMPEYIQNLEDLDVKKFWKSGEGNKGGKFFHSGSTNYTSNNANEERLLEEGELDDPKNSLFESLSEFQ